MTYCKWKYFTLLYRRSVLFSQNNITQWNLRKYSHKPTKFPSHQIRQKFLDFFQNKYGHKFVPSSSVIPHREEGTYFINAGMNQFKPIFLGTVDPNTELAAYRRVVNSQKCIRVGGKHNDLDDVGKDTYHHTFFEMLGNWSFGDYFKREACAMAWELLTEEYHLSPDRLYVTYFSGDDSLGLEADLECRDIWREIGVLPDHIMACGVRDNFWEMGETGPCGPCTEIHYDHVGGRNASSLVNVGDPRVVELWNLVFMQYDRQTGGRLKSLPHRHIDTGMGLERLAAVLQGKISNYDTDLFMPIIEQLQKLSQCRPYGGKVGENDERGVDSAYRVVADHTRMAAVAIADGLMPGIKDQQHKLRQIIHRCAHQATQVLGTPSGSLRHLVPVIVDSLGEAFPELHRHQKHIEDVMESAEKRYLSGLHQSRQAVHKLLSNVSSGSKVSALQLLDLHHGRYGHPVSVDVIQEMVNTMEISAEVEEFLKELHHKQTAEEIVSEESVSLTTSLIHTLHELCIPATDQTQKYMSSWDNGEYRVDSVDGQVLAVVSGGHLVDYATEGGRCGVVTDKTCFYAEAGGQVGDKGCIISSGGAELEVTDVQTYEKYVLHVCDVKKGTISCNDSLRMEVDCTGRTSNMRNHTATHLLQNGLRKALGDIQQAGSLVMPDKLTFDFVWMGDFGDEDIHQVEEHVSSVVRGQHCVYRTLMPLHETQTIKGLVTLKDMVYEGEVWVVSVGVPGAELRGAEYEASHSVELCGGTHVHNTAHIQDFVITNVTGIGLGTKRVTAVTGETAVQARQMCSMTQQKLNALEKAIKNRDNSVDWTALSQEIDRNLSVCILPKYNRDRIRADLDRLKGFVNRERNKSTKAELQTLVENVINSELDKHGAVAFLEKGSVKDLVKIIGHLAPQKPVMLFIRPSQKFFIGVCYVHPGISIASRSNEVLSSETWAQYVANVLGCKAEVPRGKRTQGFHMFTATNTDRLNEAMSQAKSFLDRFS